MRAKPAVRSPEVGLGGGSEALQQVAARFTPALRQGENELSGVPGLRVAHTRSGTTLTHLDWPGRVLLSGIGETAWLRELSHALPPSSLCPVSQLRFTDLWRLLGDHKSQIPVEWSGDLTVQAVVDSLTDGRVGLTLVPTEPGRCYCEPCMGDKCTVRLHPSAVVLASGVALLAKDPRQHADARAVLTLLATPHERQR